MIVNRDAQDSRCWNFVHKLTAAGTEMVRQNLRCRTCRWCFGSGSFFNDPKCVLLCKTTSAVIYFCRRHFRSVSLFRFFDKDVVDWMVYPFLWFYISLFFQSSSLISTLSFFLCLLYSRLSPFYLIYTLSIYLPIPTKTLTWFQLTPARLCSAPHHFSNFLSPLT